MEPIFLLAAFILGYIAKQIGLPPLVGFLATGFLLNALGYESSDLLEEIGNYGVLLLLFSIGLKLKIKSLFRPEVLGTATIHMMLTTLVFSFSIFLIGLTSFSMFADLDYETSLLIAFALSFSSTVFAVKILEANGDMSSPYGNIAIAILILQDIFAVIFLSFSKGDFPSPWAILLVALIAVPRLLKIRPLAKLIDRAGHGELLVLLGIILPIAAAELFDLVNLKPDLGAIIFGVLLASHKKADEISKAMLGFKDVFLVGFFLTIGLADTPTWESLGIAALLTLVLPFKTVLFFVLMTRFNTKARTGLLSSLSLTNYSEFGLIVGMVGVKAGWLNPEWLVVFALALSISFILSAPLNKYANHIYAKINDFLLKFESSKRLPFESDIVIDDSEILVCGMGRMGTSAYRALKSKYGQSVLGIDYNADTIKRHKIAGFNVMMEDATNTDFWERVCPSSKFKIVVLAMTDHAANLMALEELKAYNFDGRITATAFYEDEQAELFAAGADEVFNFYIEAGQGFADHICEVYDESKSTAES